MAVSVRGETARGSASCARDINARSCKILTLIRLAHETRCVVGSARVGEEGSGVSESSPVMRMMHDVLRFPLLSPRKSRQHGFRCTSLVSIAADVKCITTLRQTVQPTRVRRSVGSVCSRGNPVKILRSVLVVVFRACYRFLMRPASASVSLQAWRSNSGSKHLAP